MVKRANLLVWSLLFQSYSILSWIIKVRERFLPELGVIIGRRSMKTKHLVKDSPVVSIIPVITNEGAQNRDNWSMQMQESRIFTSFFTVMNTQVLSDKL